nr:hypothetical protein 22 [Elusimicrobiota bacterium]
MSELEILLNEKKEIKIADRVYKIGALSFRQLMALGKWFAEIANSAKDIKWKETNLGDLLVLLTSTDEKDVAELFSIILKENDKQFIIENILDDFKICQRILEIVCEKNDFKRLYENFIKTALMQILAAVNQSLSQASSPK